jgi:hypothetical protein
VVDSGRSSGQPRRQVHAASSSTTPPSRTPPEPSTRDFKSLSDKQTGCPSLDQWPYSLETRRAAVKSRRQKSPLINTCNLQNISILTPLDGPSLPIVIGEGQIGPATRAINTLTTTRDTREVSSVAYPPRSCLPGAVVYRASHCIARIRWMWHRCPFYY